MPAPATRTAITVRASRVTVTHTHTHAGLFALLVKRQIHSAPGTGWAWPNTGPGQPGGPQSARRPRLNRAGPTQPTAAASRLSRSGRWPRKDGRGRLFGGGSLTGGPGRREGPRRRPEHAIACRGPARRRLRSPRGAIGVFQPSKQGRSNGRSPHRDGHYRSNQLSDAAIFHHAGAIDRTGAAFAP